MARMTYWEQLKHPLWQRRRLEKMSRAGFRCEECDTDQITLNVHHKQYFKGRMTWAYEDHELSCLCELCHSEAHEIDDDIKQMLTMVNPVEVFALMCGFFGDQEIPDGIRRKAKSDLPEIYSAGFVARICGGSGLSEHRKIAQLAAELAMPNAEARMIFEAESESALGDGRGTNQNN